MTDSVKSVLRSVKNYAKGYTDVQIKVRQATSNDPWGPSGTLMAEIADATYNARDFQEIMEMVDKRLNDHGKNWRHVFKTLTLLDYLLHSGSEAVIQYAKENIYIIKTLKEFQFVDEEGKDQGANVRQKSKELTTLLNDEARLREERAARMQMRERIRDQPSGIDEEEQLKRALEESKRTAARDELRRKEGMTDLELQRTLELLAEREQMQLEQRRIANQLTGGSTFSFENPNSIDDFDPFQPKRSGGKEIAPIGSTYNPFAYQTDTQTMSSMSTSGSSNNLNISNLTGTSSALRPQLTGEPMRSTFPVEPLRTQHTGPSSFAVMGGASGFASAFDGGFGTKPMPYQGMNDANARLADMARNSSHIDPFANLAVVRTSTSSQFGNGTMSMGSTSNSNGRSSAYGASAGFNTQNFIPNGFGSTPSKDTNVFSTPPGAGALVLAGSSNPFGSGSSNFSNHSTPFGQSAFSQQPQTGGFVGANPFGSTQSSTPFGNTGSSQTFGNSIAFGITQQPYGAASSESFGQQPNNPFGMDNGSMNTGNRGNAIGSHAFGSAGSNNTPFGQSQQPFGQPQQPQPFGQPQQQQPFGQSTAFNQPFGNQQQQSFSNNPYGQQSLF